MYIFSLGDFYLGSDGPDSAPFFDLRLHIGIYRLEWGSTTPKDRESHTDTDN